MKSASSRPQGMKATVGEQVTAWEEERKNEETPESKAGVGKHTRMGIGLPMSNIFATYAYPPDSIHKLSNLALGISEAPWNSSH